MNLIKELLIVFAAFFLSSCIGDDFIDDYVEPTLRISSGIESLKEGDSHQYQAIFFNNIGLEESVEINWESTNTDIFTVNSTGLVMGISKGSADLIVTAIYKDQLYSENITVTVAEETVVTNLGDRTGTLRTTSSYPLKGTFILKEVGNDLILELLDDYETTSALPGLYVYLTNNPTTSNNAHEIGEVKVFAGTHSYNLGGEITISQYKYVLYYCKPFSVKVGDGELN